MLIKIKNTINEKCVILHCLAEIKARSIPMYEIDNFSVWLNCFSVLVASTVNKNNTLSGNVDPRQPFHLPNQIGHFLNTTVNQHIFRLV